MKKQVLVVSLILSGLNILQAFVSTHDATNFFRPSDAAVKLPYMENTLWHLGSRFEYGSRSTGRNSRNKRCNVLQIHNEVQFALDILENPLPEVDALLTNALGGNVNDFLQITQRDGIRGTQCMTGRFNGWDLTLFGAYKFIVDCMHGSIRLSAHLPITHKEIECVKIIDQTNTDRTQATAVLDYFVKGLVTDNLVQNVKQWGNLDLSNWEKTGLGDLVLMAEWQGRFPQEKEHLKEVELSGKLGLSFPTAASKDEDKVFSLPLGNDGAWGMPIGLSLGLNFVHHIRAGLDTDFMVLFDETRNRRLKTTITQTEFLLLNKGCARKEYGLTWQFHLYLQAYRFAGGFSTSVAYEYIKHDNDRLTPLGNAFDFSIVNSANNLQEWQAHNVIFKVNYDRFACNVAKTQFEFFYKLPVGGRNIIDCGTVGGQLAINF